MFKDFFCKIVLLFVATSTLAQTQTEIIPPYNIKTISFIQSNENVVPIFKLGDGFQFQFDDLFGNEANYYFEIVHCDYNWIPTDIPKTDYMKGFDGQRIQEYENSVNTLQMYSHYKLPIPNQYMQLRISGNYILKILNESRDVILSRKFIVYEDLVTVPMQIKRARTANYLDYKHNVEFSIKSQAINFQNPLKNIKVCLMQNGQLNTAIQNIVPQYTIGNDLIYKYDTQTQFWAGNEFLYFDNSDIRSAGNNISRVDSSSGIYNTNLYTNNARANYPYSLTPDVNGNFVVRNIGGTKNEIEADYAWVYFSLSAPSFMKNKGIYITGMFNNYSLSPEYKMDFNKEKNTYEKAILIKQGFTNFQYQIADDKGNIDAENAIDGNFWQTENEYILLVYYRENNDRYERVIGKASANSRDAIN
ncbi:DUF5103 domain-containing protein [Flavobacterium alvei]|jgi:hypothetical protein|uniref:DUF5103 domain-containing protein n=1 Tax=Flavobacterium alvei TaxID=2080416 RepID=A0A2S5AHF2_9FLAO|nr:DUF5103 domain-containing protein [Flavobacterium alvei]POY41553.1 DUF5103 domain-containing protein [Flavobacterium alvei]HQE33687.1 DUF5103 domain-containing protein [Flavobacterium alvei]HQF48804.1 DUF5103 domain-containing protein [Flavobacterium alvei]